MSKIYIVKSSEGEYEDYYVRNEKAFLKKEDAEAYARELDNEHNKRPNFITDEFIHSLTECEENLPDWDEFVGELTSENRDNWLKWQEDQQNKQDKQLLDLMYQRGYYITKEMLDQYYQWEQDSYTNWHDCTIEELELV